MGKNWLIGPGGSGWVPDILDEGTLLSVFGTLLIIEVRPSAWGAEGLPLPGFVLNGFDLLHFHLFFPICMNEVNANGIKK